MAKYGSTLAEVKVYINGKEQAKKELEELKEVAKQYKDQMTLANKQMLEAADKMAEARKKANKYSGNKDSAEYKAAVDEELRAQTAHDEAQKRLKENQTEHKKYQRLISESEKLTVDLETAMNRLSEQDIKHLRLLQRQLDAIRNQIDPKIDKDGTFLSYVNEAIKTVSDTIKNRKGELIEFADIAKNLTEVDDRSLDSVIKRLKELIATTDKVDAEKLKRYKDELAKTEGEKTRRVKVKAQDVQQQVKDNKWKGTIEETQRAIKLQEEYKQSLKTTDSKSLKAVEETIDGLNKKLEDYQKKQTTSVLKNLNESSYTQIQAAIEHAKKLQQAAKPGTSAWNNYGKQIANATLYLEKWNDQQKRTKMVEISKKDLGKLSDEDLKESLRYWDGMVNGIGRTNIAVEQYSKTYARFQEENAKRANKLMTSIEDGKMGNSIGQIQKNLKTLQEFRLTINPKDEEAIGRVDAVIEKLKQGVKETESGFMSFEKAMEKAKQVSDGSFKGTADDLDRIYKTLKEGTDAKLDLFSNEDVKTMKETLKLMDDVAKKRKEVEELYKYEQSKAAVSRVKGNIAGSSAGEIEETIRLAKELQKNTRTTADEYKNLSVFISNAEGQLKEWNNSAKNILMTNQLTDIKNLSKLALEEQQKYWKAMVDGAKAGDAALDTYRDNLKKTVDEEKRRLKESLGTTKTEQDNNDGQVKKSIADIKELIKEYDRLESLLDATDADGLKEVRGVVENLKNQLKATESGFVSFEEAMKQAGEIAKGSFEGTLEDLDRISKVINEGMKTKLNLSNTEDVKTLKEALKLMDDIAKEQQKAARERLEDQAFEIMDGDYTKTIEGTKQAIELLKKYQETLNATDADSINLVNEAIREMNAELDTAVKKSARKTLTTNLKTSGTEDIKKAVEWLTKYQGTLEPLGKEWREINKEIEAGNERLKAVSDRTKLDAMTDQFRDLKKLSAAALADQQKYWQSVLDNAKKGTAAYIQAELKLQAISKETTTRREAQAGAVMGNLAKHSVAEIQEAIKLTEQLRDAQKAGSSEYEVYNDEIKKAKEYLQSYIDLDKQADMEGKWGNLTTLSANALAEQKKYWQEMVNGAKQGTKELTDFQTKLNGVIKEETRRNENKYSGIAANPSLHSVSELEEAVKVFQKLRDEQTVGTDNWEKYAGFVKKATEQLKAFKDETKLEVMKEQFEDLSNLSVNAFAEQKKYWKELRDSLKETDPLYTEAIDNLKEITKLENQRTKDDATKDITKALSGEWDKTIEDTEKAIKLIEEYKKQLKTKTDADAIDEANKAIAELNANLGKAKEALMSVQDAINIGTQIKEGTFDGTTEEVLRAKKALEEYRKTLKQKTDADKIKVVDEALRNVTNAAEQAKRKLVDIDKVLGDLDSASVEDLQAAAKQLQDELEGAKRGTRDYVELAGKLREINLELKEAKKEWEGQENVIMRTAKRLAAYVAVYGGFNFVKDKLIDAAHAGLQLSDSFADIQKTTGLAAVEVRELSRDIDTIDTRTSQHELHELAFTAGQIGLKSKEDVLGFVKASNMITVSLNELGSDGTASLMKLAQLTGDIQEMGVENSLLAIGSSINELSANSAATAGPIVELMNRMGGIAAQAKISTAEMAAIGATADAIGQSMEITGTSMNKFIGTLMSNSNQIAYALNLDAKALNDLLQSGQTTEAMLMVFEKMSDMGGIEKLAPIMGDLGSEGARMTQTLSALASNVVFLREQIDLSRKAFGEAVSIENEYNIKNENAIALLERMKNTLSEMWVNSDFVEFLTWSLKHLNSFVQWLSEGDGAARLLKTAMIALGISISLASMHLDKFCKALFKAKTYTELFAGSWSKLGKAMKTNIFSILIGALVAVIYYIRRTIEYVSEAAKATAKYNRSIQEETDKVDTLFNSLKRLSTKEEERARIISQINRQYSQYLGFMLDEKDSAEKLAAAHQLINAELRNRMALNLQNTLAGKANNEYANKLEKTIADIGTKVGNINVGIVNKDGTIEKKDLYATDVIQTISELINDRVYNAVKVTQEEVNGEIIYKQHLEDIDVKKLESDILSSLQKQFKDVKILDAAGNVIVSNEDYAGKHIFYSLSSYIEDLTNARLEYQRSMIAAEQQANIELRSSTKAVLGERIKINKELMNELDKAKNETDGMEKAFSAAKKSLRDAKLAARNFDSEDKSEEAESARANLKIAQENYSNQEKALRDHYAKMVDNANDYVSNQQEILKDHYANVDKMEDGEQKKQLQEEKKQVIAQIDEYTSFAKETAKKIPGIDPWGKGRDVKDWKEFADIVTNLDSSSATALAAAYKAITEDTAKIPEDVESFYNMFEGTGLETKLKLDSPNDIAKQVHDWAEQIKNQLKTKYGRNTSLGFIFESEGGGGKKTKDEFEAALASLEAYYNDREEIVRKNALLEETTQEELDKRLQSLEQEHLSARIELRKLMLSKENSFLTTFSHAAESEYMQGIDYSKLQTQLGKYGKAMSQGLEKKLTEDMVTLQKIAWAYQEEISKILLENDPVQKVAAEYQKSFEKLDMLWSADELRTKNAAREKMATLLEFSSKRAELSDEDMRKQLEGSQQFGQIVKTMTAEEFQAFLILLDQYAEAATNAKRQATQKAIRSLEFGFDNSDMGKQVSKQLQSIEELKGQLGELQSSGLAMDASVLKKQKSLVEQRIAMEQLKWSTMIETEKNGMNRQEVLQELTLERDKKTYEARLEVMKLIMDMDAKMFEEYSSRIDEMQGWGAISEINATERKRDLINAELALQQMRIDEMIRIEEEGQNRLAVIENLRMARQDALYKADRKLTELTMQEYQQRAQVANEWGTAIGNGLGEMIAGTEDAGKALVKNLATMAVQSIGQMAQMYVAKQLLLSQQNMSEAASAMTTATTAAAEATAVGAAKTAEATAIAMATPDSVLTGGATGAAKAAVISGLIAAAVAASIAIINSLFPGAGSKATASNRKLSTGMLTYAEGNYPVLGNDGKVYDAKYEGAGMKTGVYGGGAHFGIFSEKQPEMIVDGKTTQKIILNYPYIYDAITTIAKNGRLKNAMPTFATGDYPAGMKQLAPIAEVDASAGSNEQMERMSAALEQNSVAFNQLTKLLQGGITAHLDGLETHKQQKKNERFLKRRGID